MHTLNYSDLPKKDTPEQIKQILAETEGEYPETLEGWKALFEKVGLRDVQVIDKSHLIPPWTRNIKKKLGLIGQLRIFIKVLRKWGFRGFRNVWKSQQVFQSKHTGYGITVGKKPEAVSWQESLDCVNHVRCP